MVSSSRCYLNCCLKDVGTNICLLARLLTTNIDINGTLNGKQMYHYFYHLLLLLSFIIIITIYYYYCHLLLLLSFVIIVTIYNYYYHLLLLLPFIFIITIYYYYLHNSSQNKKLECTDLLLPLCSSILTQKD